LASWAAFEPAAPSSIAVIRPNAAPLLFDTVGQVRPPRHRARFQRRDLDQEFISLVWLATKVRSAATWVFEDVGSSFGRPQQSKYYRFGLRCLHIGLESPFEILEVKAVVISR